MGIIYITKINSWKTLKAQIFAQLAEKGLLKSVKNEVGKIQNV